jgi:hypothetical protein
MIIDFLHNNVSALCRAGLVCKSWLPASRLHLFSKIRLGTMVNFGVPADITRILELICAEGSTIPTYILRLRILLAYIYGEGIRIVDEMLLRLPLLSNLKILSLSGIKMTILTPDAKKKLTTMLRNITSLTLSDFTVRNCLYPRFICFSSPAIFKTV